MRTGRYRGYAKAFEYKPSHKLSVYNLCAPVGRTLGPQKYRIDAFEAFLISQTGTITVPRRKDLGRHFRLLFGRVNANSEEENDQMKWTMGKLLLEIPVTELSIVATRPTITNCEYTASYNWVDSAQAKILVPGRFCNLYFLH